MRILVLRWVEYRGLWLGGGAATQEWFEIYWLSERGQALIARDRLLFDVGSTEVL